MDPLRRIGARAVLIALLAGTASVSACSNHQAGRSAGPAGGVQSSVSAALMRELGLPLYPGAAPTQGGGVKVQARTGAVTAAYFRSDDRLSKVEKFYAKRLPRGSLTQYIEDGNGGGVAAFTFTSGAKKKQVTLSTEGTATIIGLSESLGR